MFPSFGPFSPCSRRPLVGASVHHKLRIAPNCCITNLWLPARGAVMISVIMIGGVMRRISLAEMPYYYAFSHLAILAIHLFPPIKVVAALAHPPPRPSTVNTYPAARSIRLHQGHDAAIISYQLLLQDNPSDITAATRIAASPSAPMRHDLACPVIDTDDEIANLKQLLNSSGYNRINVGKLFGVIQGDSGDLSNDELRNMHPWGPSYITPVEAGSTQRPSLPSATKSKSQVDDDAAAHPMKSLSCLVSMFLLGFAVHRSQLEEHLIGGNASIELLELLGLAFPCEIDPSLVVPYCHLFPMDVPRLRSGGMESIILVTDFHPIALSRTTIGTSDEGAVMYIGPDSLALVQHLPLEYQLFQLEQNKRTSSRGHRILDFCAGSGIQAISALAAVRALNPTSKAVCVDISERALRFTKFNSKLNGMGDRVEVVKGDLIERSVLPFRRHITDQTHGSDNLVQTLRSLLRGESGGGSKEDDSFDIVLANPPFIPVPPNAKNDADPRPSSSTIQVIDSRYGLFSSGGADGEAVLKNILEMSPKLVHSCGFVGIVSEFMNPSESLCLKIEQWWSTKQGSGYDHSEFGAFGVLFTNQEPIDASTYAGRRADNDDEYHVWMSHLSKCCITSVSPGLLYIQRQQQQATDESNSSCLTMKHALIPKSIKGSIWTPQNSNAVHFTQRCWMELVGSNGTGM